MQKVRQHNCASSHLLTDSKLFYKKKDVSENLPLDLLKLSKVYRIDSIYEPAKNISYARSGSVLHQVCPSSAQAYRQKIAMALSAVACLDATSWPQKWIAEHRPPRAPTVKNSSI